MTDVTDAAMHALPPGAKLLGREWLGFDETGETALIRFQALPIFTNRHGTIQGGFLAAMLDSATGIRALVALSEDRTAVTSNLEARFLNPAISGPITAKARILNRTDHEITVEATLLDAQGIPVAAATARLRVVRKKPPLPR